MSLNKPHILMTDKIDGIGCSQCVHDEVNSIMTNVNLKIDKALFAFLQIAVVAVTALVEVVVATDFPGPVGTAAIVSIGMVASGAITYLATEQAAAPAA
jgi:hypothetical protein